MLDAAAEQGADLFHDHRHRPPPQVREGRHPALQGRRHRHPAGPPWHGQASSRRRHDSAPAHAGRGRGQPAVWVQRRALARALGQGQEVRVVGSSRIAAAVPLRGPTAAARVGGCLSRLPLQLRRVHWSAARAAAPVRRARAYYHQGPRQTRSPWRRLLRGLRGHAADGQEQVLHLDVHRQQARPFRRGRRPRRSRRQHERAAHGRQARGAGASARRPQRLAGRVGARLGLAPA